MSVPYLVFAGGRHSGKTTAIIEWLKEDPTRRAWLRHHVERQLYDQAGVDPRQLIIGSGVRTRGYRQVACERDSFGPVSIYESWYGR